MRDINKEQPTIKQYLLGLLDRDGRESFEQQFLTDAEFRDMALVIEDELIDDYLADLLPTGERARFESHYISGPGQQEELALTKALREYAIESEAPGTVADPARPNILERLFGKHWRPTFAIIAVLLINVVVCWVLIKKWHWGDQRPDVNAEVYALNRQSNSGEPTLSVTLTNLLSRTPQQQEQRVSIPAGINVVQLQLQIASRQYQSYQATLKVNDGPEVFSVGDLKAEETQAGHLIKLRVPTRLLPPEDYVLSVSGVTADERPESVADYFFRVIH